MGAEPGLSDLGEAPLVPALGASVLLRAVDRVGAGVVFGSDAWALSRNVWNSDRLIRFSLKSTSFEWISVERLTCALGSFARKPEPQ